MPVQYSELGFRHPHAFVSRQLGHASITNTLNVYTHLFDHAEHAASVIGRLEDRFGDLLATRADQPAQAN